METLPKFLKQRAARAHRKLAEEIAELSAEEALRDRHADWPGQTWGIGQDGSIAGIVYHLTAWKLLTRALFAPGGHASEMTDFDARSAPAPEDWDGIRSWFRKIGDEWNATLEALPEAAFDDEREWDGARLTLGQYVVEMLEHEIQHHAQIEYLKQTRLIGRAAAAKAATADESA